MELDTDILRSTYVDSVHLAIINPAPTALAKHVVRDSNWDMATSFQPSYGRSSTPTEFGARMPVKASNPKLQTCPNPTYFEDTESEYSVQINCLKNPSFESSNYQITYNVYEDPDSPEELVIDLDCDDDYHDDDSDFEVELQASSTDKHITIMPLNEVSVTDKMTSHSTITDLEPEVASDDDPDDNLSYPAMTNASMKLRLILPPNQENALKCKSECNSSVTLSNESDHSTSEDSGFNTSMTDDPNAQYPHGKINQKDTSAEPSDLAQVLLMGSNPIATNNFPSPNANLHMYTNTSPVMDTEIPVPPSPRFLFGNEKNNHSERSSDEECRSHLFAHCPTSAKASHCLNIKEHNQILWHIPEIEKQPKPYPSKQEGALASLCSYCENAPSSNMQTLINQFDAVPITSQSSKFHNNSPVSMSTSERRLHGPKEKIWKPSKSCTHAHPNLSECLQSKSYLTSSYYHHMRQQQMFINKMPVPFSWQNVPTVDDPWKSNKSRLFGVDISHKVCSSSTNTLNTVPNIDDLLPSVASSCATQEGSEDSGIGFPSTESVTDQGSSDVKQCQDADLELPSEAINSSNSKLDTNLCTPFMSGSKRHSQYLRGSAALESDVVNYNVNDASSFPTYMYASNNRRKYILDTECPSPRSNLSEPVEQTTKDVDLLLKPQLHCSQPSIDYSPGTRGHHVELQQSKTDEQLTRDWTDLSSDSLSDFRALVDAFDRSPVKPVVAASCGSNAAAKFPVLGSLVGKSVKLPKPQGYTCNQCKSTCLSSRTIRRHNARKYQCCKCEKRFCLKEHLDKHCKSVCCKGSAKSYSIKEVDHSTPY